MEDSTFFEVLDDATVFGIFDGHGGPQVSRFISNHFVSELSENASFKQQLYKQALEETFQRLDGMILLPEFEDEITSYKEGQQQERTNVEENRIGSFVGSTAIVGLIARDGCLFVANLGDSKCFLQRREEVIELSEDHTPYRVSEWERIEKAGGFVDENGLLNGTLSVARAFGDYEFKGDNHLGRHEQMVISRPDVRKIKLNPETDQYLFMGCDGLFELRNYLELSGVVDAELKKHRISESADLAEVVESVLNHSIAEDTKTGYGCDNMSAILIYFQP